MFYMSRYLRNNERIEVQVLLRCRRSKCNRSRLLRRRRRVAPLAGEDPTYQRLGFAVFAAGRPTYRCFRTYRWNLLRFFSKFDRGQENLLNVYAIKTLECIRLVQSWIYHELMSRGILASLFFMFLKIIRLFHIIS